MKQWTSEDHDWMNAYLGRKADELLTDLDTRGVVAEPRETVRAAARSLVVQVMNDMTIHLSHPQEEKTDGTAE